MTSAAEIVDEELAAQAAAGDAAAFETLVSRHAGRVYRLAYRLTGSDADAQDVLQDAFLAAYRGLASFRGAARFSTWLYRIATNAALMHRRAQGRRPTESLEEFLPWFDEHGQHVPEAAEALEEASRIDELLDGKLLAEKARGARAAAGPLPRRLRAPRPRGSRHGRGADLSGSTPPTVRQRVHRARLLLRSTVLSLVEAKT